VSPPDDEAGLEVRRRRAIAGRYEIDDTQELYCPAIFEAIGDAGFIGSVAQEFIPIRDPMTALVRAVAIGPG